MKKIISYQNLIANYNKDKFAENDFSIISYQNLVTNYKLK